MRLRLSALLAAGLLVLLLVGCAVTSMRTQTAPDYGGKRYAKLMVWVDEPDGLLMQEAEDRFVRELGSFGIEAVTSYALFFPGKEYAFAERLAVMVEQSIDGVLFVSCTGTWSSSRHVRERSTTKGWVDRVTGNSRATTKTHGGYTVTKPRASFTVELLDVGNGDVVWVAYSETKGNAYAGRKTLYRSLVDKAAGQLVEDDLVLRSAGSTPNIL